MPHPEIELISNVVETGDFVTLKRKGVNPSLFRIPEAQEIFRWLWEQYHDPAQRGEVPTADRLRRAFPAFDFCPSRNSINALITDIKRESAQIELNGILSQMEVALSEDMEPGLILDSNLPKLRRLNVSTHDEDGVLMSGALEAMRQEYETQKIAGGVVGIPYPWEVLNSQTGGMRDEEFIVIYGRPGNMKTWLLCALAANAYLCNKRVMIFSKEIQRETLRLRVASILTELSYEGLRRGNLTVEEEEYFFDYLDCIGQMEEADADGSHTRSLLFLSDKGKRRASTVEDLITAAERFSPDIVFVDGFYLMRDSRSGSKTVDWKQIAHISQDLKGMAQYLECPVVGTTQANRANAKQVTGDLDDLSFADAIGQDADIALRAFRGPNPSGKGASLMLVFTKAREAVIRPFVINANPGADFSVLQNSVNIKHFLQEKNRMEAAESQEASGGNNGGGTQPQKRKRANPFRD